MIDAMSQRISSKRPQVRIHERGATLVELMISMALGLFILAGVLQMYAISSQNSRASGGALRIQENIRYAMSRLEGDILQAGNAGCFSFIYDERESDATISGFNDNTNKNLIVNILHNQAGDYDWNRAISGINGALDQPDSLTLRYASPLGQIPITGVNNHKKYFIVDTDDPLYSSNVSRLKPFDIVMAASCTVAMVFMVTNDPVKDGYIAFDPVIASKNGQKNKMVALNDRFFKKVVGREGEPTGAIYADPSGSYTYSIGKAASATGNCNTDNPQNCALLLNNRELVEGVHNLQVEFGRQFGDSEHPNLQFVTADTDSLTDDHLGWGSIDRIRVTITFNSINNVPTNEGPQLTAKTLTKVFAVANQLIQHN